MVWPVGTSCPGSASTAASQPSAPAGTSIVLLSVSTSNSMSSAATLPPGSISHETSRPLSCAIPRVGMMTVVPSGSGASSAGVSAGLAAGLSDGAGSSDSASPSAAIRAITSPTGTSAPSPAVTRVRVPVACASTSIVALSVSTSNSTSPDTTASPAALCQATM